MKRVIFIFVLLTLQVLSQPSHWQDLINEAKKKASFVEAFGRRCAHGLALKIIDPKYQDFVANMNAREIVKRCKKCVEGFPQEQKLSGVKRCVVYVAH